MLCGRRPFDGTELTDILAAIGRDTPDLTGLQRPTPPAVRAPRGRTSVTPGWFDVLTTGCQIM
jgi:hypothetical protein